MPINHHTANKLNVSLTLHLGWEGLGTTRVVVWPSPQRNCQPHPIHCHMINYWCKVGQAERKNKAWLMFPSTELRHSNSAMTGAAQHTMHQHYSWHQSYICGTVEVGRGLKDHQFQPSFMGRMPPPPQKSGCPGTHPSWQRQNTNMLLAKWVTIWGSFAINNDSRSAWTSCTLLCSSSWMQLEHLLRKSWNSPRLI